jgi:hypothetical protein
LKNSLLVVISTFGYPQFFLGMGMLLMPPLSFASVRLAGGAMLAWPGKPYLERHREIVRAIAQGETSPAKLTVRDAIRPSAERSNEIWR